ncbi:hypothetical protein [Heyndrickxia sporothermodurans]
MTQEPRYPDGPVIGLGVNDIGLCLTHDCTPFGAVTVETFGGLHGRLDAVALAARIRELRPSMALLMSRMTPDPSFEHGVLFGCAVGLLAALGVAVEYEPLQLEAREPGHVLH